MMEQLPDNKIGQGSEAVMVPPASLGRMLREARERLGLSVADVVDQIKFAPRQIEALEADNYGSLPEPAFLRGFVRSYAKILHLDTQTLLAALPQTTSVAAELIPPSVGVPFPVVNSSQKKNLILLGAALLLAVMVVGFAVWHYTTPLRKPIIVQQVTPVPLPAEMQPVTTPLAQIQEQAPAPVETKQRTSKKEERSSAPEEQSVPVQAPAKIKAKDSAPLPPDVLLQTAKMPKVEKVPQATNTPKATSTPKADKVSQAANTPQNPVLRLVFGEESWTEIKDKDGNVISSQINPRGSELRLEGNAPFSMLIGHALSASLYYRGKQVDLKPYINEYSEVAHVELK